MYENRSVHISVMGRSEHGVQHLNAYSGKSMNVFVITNILSINLVAIYSAMRLLIRLRSTENTPYEMQYHYHLQGYNIQVFIR